MLMSMKKAFMSFRPGKMCFGLILLPSRHVLLASLRWDDREHCKLQLRAVV